MYNHFQYTEALARKLKAISHSDSKCRYFRATGQSKLQDLYNNMSSINGCIMIAVDGKIIDFELNSTDSLIVGPQYGIVIVLPTQSSDESTVFNAQEEAKNIMLQCIFKMLQDARRYQNGCDNIDFSSLQIDGFGPIADLFYGVELSFKMKEGQNYELNPEMWNS